MREDLMDPDSSSSYKQIFYPMIFDMDTRGRLSAKALFNFMQGTADRHSRSLGTSLDDFMDKGYTWVYARYFVRFLRDSVPYKPVTVETWRSRASGIMALREFRIMDDAGEMALATSSLALIDRKTRKPVPIPDVIQKQFAGHLGRAVDVEPAKLSWQDPADESVACFVRYSDLDVNGHVNNAAYLDFILENIPDKVREKEQLAEIQIDYRAEAGLRDKLITRIRQTDDGYLHRLEREADGKTLAMALTRWRKND